MGLDAVCPHCDTQFHLQAEMAGKAMRCPECKDVFTVEAKAVPPPLPFERTEEVAPPPLILDAEPVALPKPAVALPNLPRAIPLAEPKRRVPQRAIPLPEPAVKEVDWESAAPPPLAAIEVMPVAGPAALDLEMPKPKRNNWPLVLSVLIVSIVALGGAAIFKVVWDYNRKEQFGAEEADKAFRNRNYDDSAKQYDDLINQYGGPNAERYRFFAALSHLQNAANSTTLKDDPAPARAKWEAFLKEHGGSPLAKTDDAGFGADLFDAGRKIADGMANHAAELLKRYRASPAKVELLAKAEATTAASRKLLDDVNRYRPKDVPPLEEIRGRLDGLSADFGRERRRLEVLAPYRDVADDPVEERIAEFTAALARAGLSGDVEANALIAAAGAKMRSLLVPTLEDERPNPPPAVAESQPWMTIAAPAGQPLPPAPVGVPDLFLASARGWLYALDADTGNLLWTTRTGATVAPLRVALPDGGTDLVLAFSQIDGEAGVTARKARTGEVLWHQRLEAPVTGAAAVVGPRFYVPLADAAGTFVEFDLGSGRRLGSFRLRQRIGPGIVRVPGSTLIAVCAEARRIFFLDAAPQDADGDRQPMKIRGVLKTDHPELSLKTLPVFSGVGESGPRALLLLQSEGAGSTRLRALAMPEWAEGPVSESAAVEIAAVNLPGQVSFPPASDGERVAIVTDAGAFGLYATNAPGNLDGGLFALPANALPQDARDPLPALAALNGEESVWVFARGMRTSLAPSVTAASGFKLVLRGPPVAIGLPTQPVQAFPSRGALGIVLRAEASDSLRAVLFDAATGRTLWERTLGTVAAAAPIAGKDGALIVDEDGGVQRVKDASCNVDRIAPPLTAIAGSARVAATPNGAWLIVPLAGRKVQVRHVENGKLAFDWEVSLPSPLAGKPLAFGDSFVVPLADGFLHRFDSNSKAFQAGPMWRAAGVEARAECHVAALSAEELLAGDGALRIARFRWPGGAEWSAVGAGFELRAPAAFAPLVIGKQVFVADNAGAVTLFDLDKPSAFVKRWRPGEESKIPAGQPVGGFQALGDQVVYCVGHRQLVALKLDQPAAAWVLNREAKDSDLLGAIVSDAQLYATDLAGTVTVYDAAGKALGQAAPKSRDSLPRRIAVPFLDKLLMPAADGSLVLLKGPG